MADHKKKGDLHHEDQVMDRKKGDLHHEDQVMDRKKGDLHHEYRVMDRKKGDLHREYQVMDRKKGDLHQHVLPNGLRIIHERPFSRTDRSATTGAQLGISAIQVLVDFGSAHEPDGHRGVAHFIEHMCFKGTKDFSYTELFLKQNKMGCAFNASTSHRYTNYHCQINDEDMGAAIHLLASMTLNSTFPAKESVKEERVVREECLRDSENGQVLLEHDSMALLYAGSSYENPIDHISYHKKSFQIKDVKNLYDIMYHPCNIIISIISDLPWKKIQDWIRHSPFAHPRALPPSGRRLLQQPYEQQQQQTSCYHFRTKPGSETVHVAISFRVCERNHPDRFILSMLEHIVGGSLGSKIFIFLREKHGVTYVSLCDTTFFEFAGNITFYAQVDKHKVFDDGRRRGLLPLLVDFINDLIRHGVTAEELRIGKMNKRAKLLLSLGNLESQAEYNAREWLLLPPGGSVVPMRKIFETHYKHITQKQILDVCRKYLCKSNMVVCLVGLSAANKGRVERECERIILE